MRLNSWKFHFGILKMQDLLGFGSGLISGGKWVRSGGLMLRLRLR